MFHLDLLSRVRTWGQEHKQSSLDFALPWPLLPGQLGVCPRSSKGPISDRMSRKKPGQNLWKHYQIIKKQCFQVVFINLNKFKTTIMT